MAKPIIEVEGLSKLYRLGAIGATTFYESVERWWYKARGREELYRKIGVKKATILPGGPQAGPEPDTLWALKDVSFSIQRGEIVGVIGRNGAGKTTLLKILSRITEPTSGRAIIRGRTSSLLEVGTGFHPELTGRENIYLNGAILGMRRSEINRKFNEIIDFAEVATFMDTPVKRYSSGMYVRLAFAVAAHLEPEILLVDEVLAVGDAAFQKKCLGKMEDVAHSGRTILFVSHNMATIQRLTHRAILFKKGEIQTIDQTQTVINAYLEDPDLRHKKIYNVENAARHYVEISRDAEFIALELEDSETNLVYADKTLSLRLTIRGNKNADNFRFVVIISRMDGAPIGAAFSEENNTISKNETAVFRMTMADHRLAPGRYYCTLAIEKKSSAGAYLDFDVITDVLYFEMMSRDDSAGTWNPVWGSVHFIKPSVERIG